MEPWVPSSILEEAKAIALSFLKKKFAFICKLQGLKNSVVTAVIETCKFIHDRFLKRLFLRKQKVKKFGLGKRNRNCYRKGISFRENPFYTLLKRDFLTTLLLF